jgi:hypothetical protein
MPTQIRGCASTAAQRIALIDRKTATFASGRGPRMSSRPTKAEYSALKIYFLGFKHVFAANIAACPRSSH